MKKLIVTVSGGILVFFGLLFLILPGPSVLLLIPGLAILSMEYPIAKVWLKKSQKASKKVAALLDKAMLKRKYS